MCQKRNDGLNVNRNKGKQSREIPPVRHRGMVSCLHTNSFTQTEGERQSEQQGMETGRMVSQHRYSKWRRIIKLVAALCELLGGS